MPDRGSIGEAVVKSWVIRERFIGGFGLWQLMLAISLGRTDPYLLSADILGKLVSDVYTMMPLTVPQEWKDRFDEILKKAMFEVDKESIKKSAEKDPNTTVLYAEKELDINQAVKNINKWAELADKQANKSKK